MLENNQSLSSIFVADQLDTAANNEQAVLISGETGTGHELVARFIHNRSSRKSEPFVTMNCAMSGELIDAEFQAKVEQARQGTLVLENVQELPLHLQAKFVQTAFSARIIATSSANLQDYIADRQMRSDFVSKISIRTIQTPSLRDRIEQIPQIVRALIDKVNRLTGSAVGQPTAEALDALTSYTWPGNMRELEHVVERIVVTKGQGIIDVSDLPLKIAQAVKPASSNGLDVDFPKMILSEKGVDLKAVVTGFENHLVDQALARTGGNKNRASQLLGLNRTTLVEKLRKRGMITPLKVLQESRMGTYSSEE